LKIADKHRSDFLASMSHELRTPLNAIIGFSEVLLDHGVTEVPDEQRQSFLGHIRASGRRLLGLIDNLLDLSRAQAGDKVLQPEHVPLAPLIRVCVETARATASARRITFDSRC